MPHLPGNPPPPPPAGLSGCAPSSISVPHQLAACSSSSSSHPPPLYFSQAPLVEELSAHDRRALDRLGNVALQCHPQFDDPPEQRPGRPAPPGVAPRDLQAELRQANAAVSRSTPLCI